MSEKLDNVRKLAEAVAKAQSQLLGLGMMSVPPPGSEEAIRHDAVYAMARGYCDAISDEYRKVMDGLSLDEKRELAGVAP